MPQVKPTDFPLLLEVFRDGLALGLISKEEVIAWADQIIIEEDEPDYFFIEVSLSHDTNCVAEVFDRHISWPKNPISLRVLMGMIYKKLIDDTISVEQAASMVGRTSFREISTNFESNKIYEFEEFEVLYLPDITQLQVDIINFLCIYKDFSLYNYSQWEEINRRVEETLIEEQAKVDVVNESFRRAWKKREAKQKLKRYSLTWGIPALVVLIIILINYHVVQREPSFVKSIDDHENLYFLDVFGFYFIVRWGYLLLTKGKRRRWF